MAPLGNQLRHVIAIDLGGTNIKAGIVDERGRLLEQSSTPTMAHEGPDAVVDRIAGAARELRSRVPGGLAGIGIGAPGPLHPTSGLIYMTPNMPGWENYSLGDGIKARTGLEVTVENDANCAALGENWLGAGRGARTMILLTLGTGIGGGILINGRPVNGLEMAAGEVGHTVINFNGPKCGCGNHGCLEAYCGTAGIISRAWEYLEKPGTVSVLRDWVGEDRFKLTPEMLSRAAGDGDGVALSVLRETGRLLGVGIVSLVNLFAPERVVMGGGVAAAGEVLLGAIREEVRRHALPPANEQVRIVPAELGNNAGMIGAAALLLNPLSAPR